MYNALHILYFFLFFLFYHILYLSYKMSTGLADLTSISKKTEEDDHLIPFGKTLSRKKALVQGNFQHLVNFVVVCGNAVKFQDLKSILQIIVKRHLQRLSENI